MSNGLSGREQAVLSWIKQGLSNKEIGLALSISPRTVQKHLQRIYQNLEVQTALFLREIYVATATLRIGIR